MSDGRTSVRLVPDATIPQHDLVAIDGTSVQVPDSAHLVHLQFRRFAGCPICNLHLRSIVKRHAEIVARGVREVVVFHSTRDELLKYEAELPFGVIADPQKRLYVEFGVEEARRSLADPRVWPHIVRAVLASSWEILRGRNRVPSLNPEGGRLGLQADFLIAPGGRILAARYGEHAYDQWSVDELLAIVAERRVT